MKDKGLNEHLVVTTKALMSRGKNEVQYPAVNSKYSHACRVELSYLGFVVYMSSVSVGVGKLRLWWL